MAKEIKNHSDKLSEANIITLYDNYEYNPALKTGWGFSCLIKMNTDLHKLENKPTQILFDTGADSETLHHCSGDETRQLFKEEYQDNFIENGVGKIVNIK